MPRPGLRSVFARTADILVPVRRTRPRRALIERPQRRWLHHRGVHRGVAALAVAAVGVGVAGSVVLTGNAQQPVASQPVTAVERPAVERSVNPSVPRPKAFVREAQASTARAAMDRSATDRRATRDSRREALNAQGSAAVTAAVRARSSELSEQAAATAKEARQLAVKAAKKRAAERERRKRMLGDGKATLPVPGASVAAGFGATGAWARYHTGIDFSAGSGTPIHAPRAGTVTTAGSGRAGGWAGTYVTIKHSDGTSTLYAHMSSVDVSVGEEVDAGRVIGQVGQTGRAFGPHLHFELYPAGVEPGDIYNAVDPWPWLHDLGL